MSGGIPAGFNFGRDTQNRKRIWYVTWVAPGNNYHVQLILERKAGWWSLKLETCNWHKSGEW